MRLIAQLLFLLYLSAVCRPIFPVVADGLAHLLWHHHHMETVHRHYGHAHVQHEVAASLSEQSQAADHDEGLPSPTPLKSFKVNDLLSEHLACAAAQALRRFDARGGSSPLFFYLFSLNTSCSEVPVPPPDAGPSAMEQYSVCVFGVWRPLRPSHCLGL